nr:hypothetical transcript [Hymenolepis microstoma]
MVVPNRAKQLLGFTSQVQVTASCSNIHVSKLAPVASDIEGEGEEEERGDVDRPYGRSSKLSQPLRHDSLQLSNGILSSNKRNSTICFVYL